MTSVSFQKTFQQQQRSNLTFLGEDLGLHSPGGQPLEGGEPIQAFKEEEVYSTHSYILLQLFGLET